MCSRHFAGTKVWGCPLVKENASPEEGSSSLSSRRRPTLKMLELSNSMHPQYVSFQILLALNSSTYNGLSCHGLNFLETKGGEADENDNKHASEKESPSSYIKHLKILIHSRKWLRLEFHRCLGVESLLSLPAEANGINDGEDCSDVPTSLHEESLSTNSQSTRAATATEVDFLLLKFRRTSTATDSSYDKTRHSDFFTNLWNHWKVRKLSLSMKFTPEWTREFCRREISMLEDLELHPDCTWHRRTQTSEEETPGTEAIRFSSNGNDVNNDGDRCENNKTFDWKTMKDIDCWELFCRELRINHPRLRSLEVRCKTGDEDLTYLIDHAIAPTDGVADSQIPSSVLAIETLIFGKMCNCDEKSLRALSRVLESSLGRRWKALTISRGIKLPSRAALDNGHTAMHPDRSGLLAFCRALQHARTLRRLELGDYVLDETKLTAIFESLVSASGGIERLSLFSCATTSPGVYEQVLCGSDANRESQPGPDGSSTSSSCLIQNRLPSLRLLHLPKDASKALCEVLKSNTSIEWINNHKRTKTHEYYLDLNRGGRRILTASSSVLSPSLWPKVLERASSNVQNVEKDRYCGGTNRKHDVVYCLLRNRILLEL